MLPAPAAVVVIEQDLGGSVDAFADRVLAYRESGTVVRIQGFCASACTMVTGLPRSRICVGPDAELAFHQAYVTADPEAPRPEDVYNRSERGVALLMRFYPPRVRAWISRHGGLTATLISLKGAELRRLFRACPTGR